MNDEIYLVNHVSLKLKFGYLILWIPKFSTLHSFVLDKLVNGILVSLFIYFKKSFLFLKGFYVLSASLPYISELKVHSPAILNLNVRMEKPSG